MNRLPIALIVGGAALSAAAGGGVWYFFSPMYTDVGYQPIQPVPYSHLIHVGKLNLDCRYCHVSVESSSVANIPPTQTCMNCHSVALRDSPLLAPIRNSAQNKTRMMWLRVHKLPDYAYFNHNAHIGSGVGCASCHGRVDQMEVVHQVAPLSMSWCLECHRDPGPHLRPLDQITNMDWAPPSDPEQAWQHGQQLVQERQIKPPVDCSGCHR